MTTTVTVARDDLGFSAAHFLTIPGHKCERLHGHNYGVSLTVEGGVDDATGFVIDFAVLKAILRPALEAVDHRVLVPTENPAIRLDAADGYTTVWVGGERRYLFPSAQVAALPVRDTTAERLAAYLAELVWRGLAEAGCGGITKLVVLVEESPGQHATFTKER